MKKSNHKLNPTKRVPCLTAALSCLVGAGHARWLTVVLAVVALAACSGRDGEIRAAAQGYLDAMGNYHPSEARPYATEETCDVTLAFFERMMQHTDPKVYANNIPAVITLGDITFENDSVATIAFHKHTPTTEQDGILHMLRRNGKWRAHEVIEIPSFMNQPDEPRTFTDQEVEEMRGNGQ